MENGWHYCLWLWHFVTLWNCTVINFILDYVHMTLKPYHPWRPPLRSKQQWVPRSKSCRIKNCVTTLFQCIFFWKDYSKILIRFLITTQKLSQYFERNCSTHHTEITLVFWKKLLNSSHRSYLSILKEIAQLTTQKLP